MDDSQDLVREALLAQSAWMRRLAARLVDDAVLAEEVAQETWVAALRRPPPPDRPLRRWLAAVLRNVVRQRHRNEASRRGLERERAAQAETHEVGDAVLRLAVHRALVDALAALAEPYRSTLIKRYFDGLSPKRIAETDGVPVKTVYSRLDRGLAQLREALERRGRGDRSRWLGGLVLLARDDARVRALRRTASRVLVASAAALLMGLGALLVVAGEEEPGGRSAEPVSAVAPRGAAPAAAAASAGRAEREPAGVAPRDEQAREPASAAPAELAARPPVRGRVVDFRGRPLAGVSVVLREGTFGVGPAGRLVWSGDPDRVPRFADETDADGAFELPLTDDAKGELCVDSAAWATVVAASFKGRPVEDPRARRTIVCAPRRPLAGTVLTATGRPVAGAPLSLVLPADALRDVAVADLEPSVRSARVRGATDEQGRFELAQAFALDGLRLRVEAGGHEPREVELDPAQPFVVVRLPERARAVLRGRVLLPDLRPAAGALVGAGEEPAAAGREGEFEVLVPDFLDPPRLVAAAPGRLPAVVEPERDAGGALVWPEPLELVLGGPPATLEGRVVDGAGLPVADALVWAADPTFFARGWAPLQVEHVVGTWEAGYFMTVRTDAAGAFRLGGLLEREYRLRAMRRGSLLLAEAGPARAGSGEPVELVLDDAQLGPPLRGRVATRTGIPLAEARVALARIVVTLERPWRGEPLDLQYVGAATLSAQDGTFAFPAAARAGLVVTVQTERLHHQHRVGPDDDPGALEIRVPDMVAVRVEPARATRAEFRDAVGRLVEVRAAEDPTDWSLQPELAGPRELLVPEDAVTCSLLRDDELLRAQPLALVPGELALIVE